MTALIDLERAKERATTEISPLSPNSPRSPASLGLRLILLVAGTMLPLVLLTTVIIFASYRQTERTASERVLQTTRSAMASVDRELQNQIAALQVLALSPALHKGDFAAFRSEAERFLSRFPQGTAVAVSDESAQLLFTTNGSSGAGQKRVDIDAVNAVFAQKKPLVSNVYMAPQLQTVRMTVDVPVMDDGVVAYDLAFNPPRAIFANILTQLSLPSDWVISIFDRNDHHVARLPALATSTLTSATDSLRTAMQGVNEGVVPTTSLEGNKLLTAFTRSSETGWIVAIGMPIDAQNKPARQPFFITLAVGVALMLTGFAFARHLATQLARAEAHRELLMNELNHRVKNTLSSVQAIVSRSLRNAGEPAAIRKAIEARLMALSHAHNILSDTNWESADLRDIATSVLAPYLGHQTARAALYGPQINLRPRIAITLAMVLNELVTNAAKYGAFAASTGTVELSWNVDDSRTLRLSWREFGGPRVEPPTYTGYGTQFIERAIANELSGTVEVSYSATGLICNVAIPLS